MKIQAQVLLPLMSVLLSIPAHGAITFNAAYDASFAAQFGGNTAAAQAAITNVLNAYSADFSDPININITFFGNAGTSILGQSTTFLQSFTYAQLYNAELADLSSADDFTATHTGGSLGGNGTPGSGTNPTGGGAFWASTAEAKALKLTPDSLAADGAITLGAGFSYTFSGAIAPGTFDFQGVVAHEVSEVMGRIGLSGTTVGSTANSYTLLDAYALTGIGAHAPTKAANDFFSIDNGTTLLLQFNSAAGDSRDWAGSTNDAFNASSSPSVSNPVSATDLRELDVIGYDLTSAQLTPEPGTMALLGAGFVAMGIAYRRRRRA